MSDENTETKQPPDSPLRQKSPASEERIPKPSTSDSKPPIGSLRSASFETKTKIDVLLKPAGDAPIMKKKKWAVERSKRISWICEFLKKYLKFDAHDSMSVDEEIEEYPFGYFLATLNGNGRNSYRDREMITFIYVNQAFAPSPDTEIGTVFDCFGSDGKLVLHYCRTQAWG